MFSALLLYLQGWYILHWQTSTLSSSSYLTCRSFKNVHIYLNFILSIPSFDLGRSKCEISSVSRSRKCFDIQKTGRIQLTSANGRILLGNACEYIKISSITSIPACQDGNKIGCPNSENNFLWRNQVRGEASQEDQEAVPDTSGGTNPRVRRGRDEVHGLWELQGCHLQRHLQGQTSLVQHCPPFPLFQAVSDLDKVDLEATAPAATTSSGELRL